MSDGRRAFVVYTLAMTALAVAIVWSLYLARGVLLLVYVSLLLAIGFSPLVRAIEHQRFVPIGTRIPRWLAILVVYLLIVTVVVAIGAMVVPPLVEQAQELWRNLPRYADRAQRRLVEYGVLSRPITLREAVERAPGSPGGAVGTLAAAVGNVATAVVSTVTVLILTFYLLVEGNSLFAAFARLFPPSSRPRMVEVSREISRKVSAWLTGQLILAGTIGASSAVGLYLLGVPYFYVLALISAIGELIPVVGPVLAAVPATLAALTVSPRTALWVLAFFVAQQQAENHLLVPNIMGRQVGVNAVVVIVGLLVGGSLLGVIGAVLAVPTAAVLQVIVEEWIEERDRRQGGQLPS